MGMAVEFISPKVTVSGTYTYDGNEQEPGTTNVTVEDGGNTIPSDEYTLRLSGVGQVFGLGVGRQLCAALADLECYAARQPQRFRAPVDPGDHQPENTDGGLHEYYPVRQRFAEGYQRNLLLYV